MDFPVPPPHGPVFGIQQQRNLLPVVPSNQEFYRIFLKGHPNVIGAIQITLVLLHWSLGAVLSATSDGLNSITANCGIPYWASVFYLISGGLCVAVEIKPSRILVKWTISFTASSCFTSFIEFCFICMDLNRIHSYVCPPWETCCGTDYLVQLHGIALGFLLFACLEQLGMSFYLLFIGKRAMNVTEDYTPQVYAVNNEYKYFVSYEMSQPANENTNYITPDSKI